MFSRTSLSDVWGRQRGKPKTVDFDGAVDNAFANLMTVKDFAAALELQVGGH
jgi:hypothetical protein